MIPASYLFKDLYRRRFVDPPIDIEGLEVLQTGIGTSEAGRLSFGTGRRRMSWLAVFLRDLAQNVANGATDGGRWRSGPGREASTKAATSPPAAIRTPVDC